MVVDKHVSSSIYISGFYDFLWFMLDLYIIAPLKCFMTSASIKSIETTNSLFCGSLLNFFFHVFVKFKHDLRLKYVLVASIFLFSNFYLSINGKVVYNNVRLCNRLQFYSPDYISTCNELYKAFFCLNFLFSPSLKLKQ